MKTCSHCGEEIKDGEAAMPSHQFHLECFWRGILGSVGHLNKRCSCYGGTESDPPEMTLREAAKAACALYAKLQDANSPKVLSMSDFERVRDCALGGTANDGTTAAPGAGGAANPGAGNEPPAPL
jgi:hypothetical protein